MEVIEDGNIMDRIPILLQRDLEYYQSNQTVLSETVCHGVVGGRLDFPRNASFAAVKIVLWLEEEFSIAFQQGSGMFVVTEHDVKSDGGVAKTSDPDKFVQLVVKSSDALLEHLHVLVQEALDHADLPVLTATLGAAALLRNTLHCHMAHVEDGGNADRLAALQACYKRYLTMSEAVAERVLDLHCRVVSLYVVQDAGGCGGRGERGAHSVQGWWLYMNGSRKDLWDTVPPRMAQRIFAGMLNESLTIFTVRYCQMATTESSTPALVNDIVNILLCAAQLLPSICGAGDELAGLGVTSRGAGAREVRDVHAKCNELFKCAVFRGAELHFIHDAFKNEPETPRRTEGPYPWFTFVSPKLFDNALDCAVTSPADLPTKTALGLDLTVLLAQPQPNWNLLVKVLMMRDCHLARSLLTHCLRHMSRDNARWPAHGRWYSPGGAPAKCQGFLCTADGFCRFQKDQDAGEEYARAAGALTHVVASVGSAAELKSTLCYALELSGRDWSACLDKRQVWCDRRPSWLAGILALVGSSLQFIPPILVHALQNGASMYQTMSTCLCLLTRAAPCVAPLLGAARCVTRGAPAPLQPAGGHALLQILVTVLYEEMVTWANTEANKEKSVTVEANGQPHDMASKSKPKKQVRIISFGNTATSSSVSFDSAHSSASSAALAVAEALCSIDEDHKHTLELERLLATCYNTVELSDKYGLEDFPDFAELYEEGDVPGSNAERASDAAALTSQLLMTSAGRDSLRVIYDHIHLHSERIFSELDVLQPSESKVPLSTAPLLYIMFHIGRRPFDQYLRGEWPMPWSKLVSVARAWSARHGARAHVTRRPDVRGVKANAKGANKQLLEVYNMFKTNTDGLL